MRTELTSTFVPVAQRLEFVPAPSEIKRFTVAEYHRIVDTGVFDDERVELLEGWIVRKAEYHPPHEVAVKLTAKALDRALPDGWHTRAHSSVTFGDSEPSPDIAVVAGPERDYTSRHPVPSDIAMVIEVSDYSLDRDRSDKGLLYARVGIPVFWIVNLPERVVEVYTLARTPAGVGTYGPAVRHLPGASVPLTIGGQSLSPIPVDDLLP